MVTDAERESIARRAGARPRAGELVGGKQFDVEEQKELNAILGTDYIIVDYAERKGRFGKWVVILLQDPETGDQFTTATGGMVVVAKLEELREKNSFPIVGQFTATMGEQGEYFDLV